MTKQDRIKHLPPAAKVAMVCPYDVKGGVLVKTRYVRKPHDWSSRSVHPGMDLWGVPFDAWKRHEGRRPIRLWEWHGTGEGMIGGPAKRQADFTFFGSMWEFPHLYSREELLRHAMELAEWLADDRYEFSERCRAEVEGKIASNRRLAGIECWDEMGSFLRWGHSLGLRGPAFLATCDDNEL